MEMVQMAYPQNIKSTAEPKLPALVDAERRISASVSRVVEATQTINNHADVLFGATPTPVSDNAIVGGSSVFYRISDLESALENLEVALRRFN
jgi:hypothetical protein